MTYEEILSALNEGAEEVVERYGKRIEIDWQTKVLFEMLARGLTKVFSKVVATPENVSQEIMRTILNASQGGNRE